MAKTLQLSSSETPQDLIGRVIEYELAPVAVESVSGNTASITHLFTRKAQVIPLSHLNGASQRSYVDLNQIDEQSWERATRIRQLLEEIERTNATKRDDLENLAKNHGFKLRYRQIQRKLSRYRAQPSVTSCVDMRRGRRRGGRLLSGPTEFAISKALKSALKIGEVLTLEKVRDLVEEECKKTNAKLPSNTALRSRMKSAGLNLSKRRVSGPTVDASNSKVYGGENKVGAPLEEIQIDHTKVDVRIVDENGNTISRRPWLTLVLDIYSRVILGFYLSLRNPSIHAVSRALLMAARPKDELLRRMEISLIWPTYGRFRRVHTDNAKEFKCEAFIRGCEEEGIEPKLRPLGKKHWGGHIERVVGTMMGQVHLLPGTTFSNSRKRGDYDSEEKACLTLADLSKWIVLNIIQYNNDLHTKLHESPFSRWNNYWTTIGGQRIEHKFVDEVKFYYSFLEEVRGKLQKDGIHWGNNTYFEPYLRKFRVGTPFRAKVDRANTRTIFLQDSDGKTIVLRRKNSARFDDFELEREFRANKRRLSNSPQAVDQIARAKVGKKEIVEKALARKAALRNASVVPAPSAIEALNVTAAETKRPMLSGPVPVRDGEFVMPNNIRVARPR